MSIDELKQQNLWLRKQLGAARSKLPKAQGLIGDFMTLDEIGGELDLTTPQVQELFEGQQFTNDSNGRACIPRSTLDFVLTQTAAGKSTKLTL